MKKTFTFFLPVFLSLAFLQSFASRNPFFQQPTTGITMIRSTFLASNGNTADGNAVVFDAQYSNDVDEYDAVKLMNAGENFGVYRAGYTLAVEARSTLSDFDTVFYRMSGMLTQNYSLKIIPLNFQVYANDYTCELYDKYLNRKTLISLTDTNTIDVKFLLDPASKATDRFMLVFKTNAVLPVNFVSVSAELGTNNSVIVRWATEEYNVKKYIVQRSADGANFVDVGEVVSNNAAGTYSYTDQAPVSDYSFYRVLAIDNSLKTLSSNVVRIVLQTAGGVRANVRLFPNPSTNHTVNIQFNQSKIGNYRVRLVSSFGQQLYSGSIRINDANGAELINLPSSVRPGNYMLSVIGEDGTTNTQMLMVQ
jgi:hypothetical protein